MAKAKIDKKAIRSPLEKAFRSAMFRTGRAFTEVISDPNAFDGFENQDIVDTGRLRASQRLTFPGEGRARFSWPIDYGVYVLNGYTLRNGVKVEGRNWIVEGLKRAKIEDALREEIGKQLKG